jgi:hypothetical protein
MISNHKKHKEIQFHKLPTKTFKTTKKLDIFRDQNELCIKGYYSPTHKRGQRNSVKSFAFTKFLKQVDTIYSPTHKRLTNKGFHKMNSTNKIYTVQFKNCLTNKFMAKKEEEEKKGQMKELSITKNRKRPSKIISSNNIFLGKKYQKYNSISNKYNFFVNNESQKADFVNYNIEKKISNITNKEKKIKKGYKKTKENKENNKEEKNNNNNIVTEDKGKLAINNKKKKFFCCL